MTSNFDDRLAASLAAVAGPPADDALIDRVVEAAERRRARRRVLATAAGAGALALVLAGGVWFAGRGPLTAVPGPVTPPPAATAPSTTTPAASPSEATSTTTPQPTQPTQAPGVPVEPTPTASNVPTSSPVRTPSTGTTRPTDVGSPGSVTVTTAGIGELRIGMTVAEGVALGIATDEDQGCVPWTLSELGMQRYPEVWTYWNSTGLKGLATKDPRYVSYSGVRPGDTMARVRAVYGDRLTEVPLDADHWMTIDESALPSPDAPHWGLTALAVDEGGPALVFIPNGADPERVEYLLVTRSEGGRYRPIYGC
nr:hypothetical protein [Propionibacterium sp.]